MSYCISKLQPFLWFQPWVEDSWVASGCEVVLSAQFTVIYIVDSWGLYESFWYFQFFRYRILQKISFGSYGSIYSAVDLLTNRDVAVKFEIGECIFQGNHSKRWDCFSYSDCCNWGDYRRREKMSVLISEADDQYMLNFVIAYKNFFFYWFVVSFHQICADGLKM